MAYTVAAAPSWPAPSPAAQAPQLHLKTSEEWGRQEAQRVLRLFMPRVPEILLVPNLRLLYQGPVVQLGFRVKRLKKRHAFLFPGILVIARQLPGGKFNPRWLIALSSRKAVSAVVDSQYFIKDVEFRVYSPLRTFTLFAREPAERDAWIRMIESEMAEVKA